MVRNRPKRHTRIMELLNQGNSVRIEDLRQLFDVSDVTLRMDLAEMERQGLVIRTHGGAVRVQETSEIPYTQRTQTHFEEKVRIGKAAAGLINDGEVIILDSGSTSFEVAKQLADRPNVTIITNDLQIGTELALRYHPQAHVLGGMINTVLRCLYGPETESALEKIRVDKLFLATHAIGNNQLFERSSLIAQVKRAMIRVANEVVLIADSSKFGQSSHTVVSELSCVSRIVTDDALPAEQLSILRENHEVILA